MSSPLLRTLFLHHDGIVLGATLAALKEQGLLDRLWRAGRICMGDVLSEFPGNDGYLHVALRSLALQGWLQRSVQPATGSVEFEVTAAGEIAGEVFSTYAEIGNFIFSRAPSDEYFLGGHNEKYSELAARCVRGWDLPSAGVDLLRKSSFELIRQHLDGLMVGPLMIALKRHGLLEAECFPEEFPVGRENLQVGLELLRYMQWVERRDSRWYFTQLGREACKFSLHYGLTLSYSPLFRKLPELLFRRCTNVTLPELGHEETHVDRTLNVLASGTAHRRYFEESDAIIAQIFDREPVHEQPAFVADMGCGDGTWLQRIFELVRDRTLRGKHLAEYPLLMVGADFNAKALEVAQLRLEAAGVPHLTLFGDVTDPDQFADSLHRHGLRSQDGLHIRAFIDHNRQYTPPRDQARARARQSLSSGAYANPDGTAIPNQMLEQNLVEHFCKWLPHVHKHGLILIEAHNVEPAIAAQHRGKCHAGAFDTYHGYSNQYPVDFEAFMTCAEEAGLRPVLYEQHPYPSRLPFVAISLNRFKPADSSCLERLARSERSAEHFWVPETGTDRTDGEALHRLLYRGGDLTKPAWWCYGATSRLVAQVVGALEQRIQSNNGAPNSGSRRRISILDYGAGTGLATVELIKALVERGLLERMTRWGIDFKLLLVDLPSSWFAKAHDLLGDLPFVEFHSLRSASDRRIGLVTELLGTSSVDIVMASMVLHLIPPKALPGLIDSFAAVLKPEGQFVWNSPDTPPATSDAQLVHAANRVLRDAITDALDGTINLNELLARMPAEERAEYVDLVADIQQARTEPAVSRRAIGKAAGATQILPVPTDISVIRAALDLRFTGDVLNLVSLMRDQELLDLAHLPANQRFFSEIEEPRQRLLLTRLLLTCHVIPALRAGPAGHPAGINLQWSYGQHTKRG
jgi:SAM-dependent methyltransferase